ncbi:hypothetical protein BT93_L2296 [Corymbia citriodora subsp. variegata]|uniref:TIR domain-containing protein n=1 Tax=Corymbia citriodora subsp. variegata TaxID=360336 RepID=A0A8T0CK12_CORYI|nr:hypothetical protein BT93_L2296 [Corymbia citriodora subsp. variegata]
MPQLAQGFPKSFRKVMGMRMEFEVFLSFRGPDTRDNFTSCLYSEMVEKGIHVFKDDEELQVSQKIGDNLLRALDTTQIYIPIFSKGFASNPWCLREVAHMVDCTSKSDGKKEILPIFFDVEPDDVKLKTELYRNALFQHEVRYGPNEVKRWEAALVEIPTRVGWRLEGKSRYGELIKSIVLEVLLKLNGKMRFIPDHLVETDDLRCIEELLDIDFDDQVRFIIIHGTGSIGKSTLASIIFNRFRSEFNCSSFLEDVRYYSLLDMQKKLLSEILGSTSAREIYDTNHGIDRIKRGLGNKKVLIVLDNVDEKRQLKKLTGRCDWFGFGSRIIVTIRDIRTILDEGNQTRACNYLTYQVKEMPLDQAIQLFSRHVFRSDAPPMDYYTFLEEVISSIGRLPLTLEVVGSLFTRNGRSKWNEILRDLKQVPCGEVRETLMISLNKLNRMQKVIFLEIACYCIGEDEINACYMWDDCGYSPRHTIDALMLMSLIKIDKNNKLWMHDELRDLGRYIVKEENFEDVGKHPWVWIDENTSDILMSNEEKPNVQALSVGINHDFTPNRLAHFPNLRFLGGEKMNFVGDFRNLLHSLRWLSWPHCPLDLSIKNFHLVNLVVLNLSRSNITHDWGGWRQIETPDFSEFGKLEKLILAWCVKLSTIDSSIDIRECHSLQGLPDEIGSLECLSEIIMPSGGKPFKLSETLGNLKYLTKFEIRFHYGINLIPLSIGRLTNLTNLSLRACKNLCELPDSIGELESLIELDLQLSRISILPDSIGYLKRLKVIRVGHTKIQMTPYALGGVKTLEVIDASFCLYLHDEIPWEMWSLTCLRILDLYGSPISRVPTKINGFSNLQELKISSHQLCPLPELPSSLKYLEVEAAQYPILPNLSSLVHLHHLKICGSLSNFACRSANEDFWPEDDDDVPTWMPPRWLLSGFYDKIAPLALPNLEYLERLRELKISSYETLVSTPNLSRLKRLQRLQLSDLPNPVEIPGLGELESLKSLHIAKCNAIEQ